MEEIADYGLYRITTSASDTTEEDAGGIYTIEETTTTKYTPVLSVLESDSRWQDMYRTIVSTGNTTQKDDWDGKGRIYVTSHEIFVKFALVASLYEGLPDSVKLDILAVLIEEGTVKYVLKRKNTVYKVKFNEGVSTIAKDAEPGKILMDFTPKFLYYHQSGNSLVVSYATPDDLGTIDEEHIPTAVVSEDVVRVTYPIEGGTKTANIADRIILTDFYAEGTNYVTQVTTSSGTIDLTSVEKNKLIIN